MPAPKLSSSTSRDAPDADVIIIGGGLAGLATATLLHDAGKCVIVLEARAETGGRIRSVRDQETGGYLADLGPTWVWPAYQPVVQRWLDRFGLACVAQFDDGQVIAEMARDTPPVTTHLPGQDGSFRIIGGPQALIDRLTRSLPAGAIRTEAQVTAIDVTADAATVTFAGQTLTACHIIVSVPPRIAIETMTWTPGLPPALQHALRDLPTWMAPHAKVVAHYETAFWRDRGLSGRIMSRVGPLVEVHDHSGPDGTPAALFGFVGWPHERRAELGDGLADAVRAQLGHCFGAAAPTPTDIHIKDWASDPLVAIAADRDGPGAHPAVGPATVRDIHFDGNVSFAVAETAAQSPGLIEGALVAAEHTAGLITRAV